MVKTFKTNVSTYTKLKFFRVNLEQTKEENANSTTNGNTWQDFFTTNNCIYIYSSIIILFMVVALATSYLFYNFSINASNNLHNNMFSKIVYGPMYFFNTNPSGRILNRFSKDMGCVDEMLPLTLGDALQVSE